LSSSSLGTSSFGAWPMLNAALAVVASPVARIGLVVVEVDAVA
jgi:hypothetical protein